MYKGAAPIQYTLLNGDSMTGTSIMEISPKKFDDGKIILQERVPIAPDDTYSTLKQKLIIESELLVDRFFDGERPETIPNAVKIEELKEYQLYSPKFQNDASEFRFSSPPNKTPNNLLQHAYNMYRAFYGSRLKGLKLYFNEKIYFVDQCEILSLEKIHHMIEIEKNHSWMVFLDFHRILGNGDIWFFRGVKIYQMWMAVKFNEGYLMIKEGHFQKESKKSATQFLRLDVYNQNMKIYSESKLDNIRDQLIVDNFD